MYRVYHRKWNNWPIGRCRTVRPIQPIFQPLCTIFKLLQVIYLVVYTSYGFSRRKIKWVLFPFFPHWTTMWRQLYNCRATRQSSSGVRVERRKCGLMRLEWIGVLIHPKVGCGQFSERCCHFYKLRSSQSEIVWTAKPLPPSSFPHFCRKVAFGPGPVDRMRHRKRIETKQQPSKVRQ